MSDGAYIEHTFGIYSAYIGTCRRPRGEKGIGLHLSKSGRGGVFLSAKIERIQREKRRTDEDNRPHAEGEGTSEDIRTAKG